MAKKRWILLNVLLTFGAMLVVAVICALPYTREQLLRHQMKVTVTHMSQLGRLCALTKPTTTDCHDLLANVEKQGIDLSPDTCLDGWSNPIRIELKYDSNHAPHYVLTSAGPEGKRVDEAAFVWAEGHFEKWMPGTPP